uniref:SusC/RagA family TonB-linked outer membrane protein n=1 Tax=Pedobacter schmidteae TaxID=2201271 RepID=UPI000EAC73C9|nr:SusC/RagA family TonB-linked outer membrane protein [Pedobacter schmidteae]
MKFYALFKRRHLSCVAQVILRILDSVFCLIRNTDKRKLIMRINLTVILLTSCLLQVSASGYAQKINLVKNNISLTEVFKEIRKQSGYDFVYATPQIKLARKVDIMARNASLSDVLEKCFFNQPFSYEIQNKTIVIMARTNSLVVPERRIQGVVTDRKDGSPLPGVTVMVKGTKAATQTDAKGRFVLNVPNDGTILVVRFLGYKTQELPLANFEIFNIRMEEDEQALEAVVVTGLFERKEGNFTGAVKSITGAELKAVSSNNIFKAISALDPSFRIIPNNVTGGNINQLPEIQLRGANSMPNLGGELSANPNAPLFILDGFEVTLQRVADLDMNMINSITILKDASATSIYGSRGANGVMVITSVAPLPGKVQITFNNDFRLTTPDLSVYNLLDAKDKLNFEKRTGVFGDEPQYSELYNNRLIAVASGVNTDWLVQPVQTGYSNRSSLYLQGGDSYIRYGMQLSGDFQSGVMKGQNRNNYSGQFDITYTIKKFRFQNSIRLYQNIANESPYGSFDLYAKLNPYWKPFDANGNVLAVLERRGTTVEPNPMFDATLNSINKTQFFGISNNFQMRYDIKSNLFIESNFSLNKENGSTDKFFSAQHSSFAKITDVTRKGSYSVRNNNSFGFESSTNVNYNKSFGKNLIYSTLGFNFASNTNKFYSIITEGFAFDKLDNLLFATQYQPGSKPDGDESTVNRVGALLNLNYSYDNRYVADFSIRKDGSSQFGADKRYGTFWSTGLGWNIHNEAFLADNVNVNRLKLRSSYGSSGSLNIPAYSAQTRYNFSTGNIYDGELGASIMGIGNSDLSWQDVRKFNIGLDMLLFKERLDVRIDHYRTMTKNTITQVTLAPSTGFLSYSENFGKIQNTGYEFAARYKIINQTQNGIFWTVNASAFRNNNILKELSNSLKTANDKIEAASTQRKPNILLKEGESINTLYVVKSLGVDPISGQEVFLKKDGTKTFNWNVADKIAFGVTDPRWSGTFGTNLSYKGFDLGLIFDYRFGGQMYNQTLVDKVESVDPNYNADRRAYDLGWSQPGDQTLYTRIVVNKAATRLTSRFVQDENTVNLTSASLGYNFYRYAFVKKIGLRSLQLTAITNDLFRISSIEIERGISNPFARTFSLSLRAGF